MARRLEGLSVLITGGASGIGRRLAFDLYEKERCRLVLLDLDAPALEDTRAELKALGADVSTHHCDVGSTASVEQALAAAAHAPIDILVNNAGILYAGPFESMPVTEFERVVNVNLLGAVRLTQLVLPRLLESRHAAIVNVASLAGLVASPGMCAYSASKFGLVGFSDALRGELKGRVHVCTVAPSLVRTEIVRRAGIEAGTDPDARNRQVEWMDSVLEKAGSDPRKTSEAIIKALKTEQELVLVNPDSYFFYYLKRLAPATTGGLARGLYRKLSKPWSPKP